MPSTVSLSSQMQFASELATALGLDPGRVRCLSILADATTDDIVTVTAELVLEKQQAESLVVLLKRYRLKEIDDDRE